jgi:hypothetical protein
MNNARNDYGAIHSNDSQAVLRFIFTSTLDKRYPSVDTATGWHSCFEALEQVLDGEDVEWTPERVKELRKEYAARLA